MAKDKTIFYCTECGGESLKWQGQCPHCSAWNTLSEGIPEKASSKNRFSWTGESAKIQNLSHVKKQEVSRISTGMGELDRVLGGGLVPGSIILLGGDPGIGKSTILLQTMGNLSITNKVLYVSGEESAEQVALRADRLSVPVDHLSMLAENNLEKIQSAIAQFQPNIVVIDSIQTVYSEELSSAPGSVTQVRECSAHLTRVAKQAGVTIILVGHVTKDGTLAGPKVLEHIVDAVLYFEGDQNSSFRIIRGFKNRFGALNEMGVFSMTDKGLQEITNPSAMFLSHYEKNVPGSCVLVAQEGTRPLLVEIQALVDESAAPNPRRLAVGLDGSRLAMLMAVLNRHAGVDCHANDVFVNAVGGVRILEPGADLAITGAILSSLKNKPMIGHLALFGEIGLTGEIRPVQHAQDRVKEALKLGFSKVVMPKANSLAINGLADKIEIVFVDRVHDLLTVCFE